MSCLVDFCILFGPLEFLFYFWMVVNVCCDVCRRGVSQCSKNVTADFNGKWPGNMDFNFEVNRT